MMKAIEHASNVMVAFAKLGIVVMLVLVVADVLVRAILNTAIPGIDTIVASYLMVSTIFLPLALLHMLEENIAVEALFAAMPVRVQELFDIIAHILAVGFYGLLGWIYYEVAVEAFHIKEYVTGTWDVPIWPARVFMPIGLALGTIAAAAKLVNAIRNFVTGQTPPPHDTAGAF